MSIDESNVDLFQVDSASLKDSLMDSPPDSIHGTINVSEYQLTNELIKTTQEDRMKIKQVCQQWQYLEPQDGQFVNHGDMRCIAYNFCYMKYQKNKSNYIFQEEKFTLNFKHMTETVEGNIERRIKRVDDSHIKIRPTESSRLSSVVGEVRGIKLKQMNFDKNSFEWLAESYKRKYGLRDWNWKTMFKGIKTEHMHEIKQLGALSEIDGKFVHVIWDMILKSGGVDNINATPKLDDPEHKDVKLILTMYSLESFLFKRLNESSRLKETNVIETLGPFAVALTYIIDNIQHKRLDGIEGEFICYSGMALERSVIEEWKTKEYLDIEGYRSTSTEMRTAMVFAAQAETDEKDQVILKIRVQNKYGKYYICLDRADYTMYLDEKEVLLQAGLRAKIDSIQVINEGNQTVFNLYIPDDLQIQQRRKRTLDMAIPIAIYSIGQFYGSTFDIYYYYYLEAIIFDNDLAGTEEQKNAMKKRDIIDDYAMLISGFDCLLNLLMVGTMIRLIQAQNQKLLVPATASLFVFAISHQIRQTFLREEGYEGYFSEVTYYPYCRQIYKKISLDWFGMIAYYSYQFFNLSMIPFLMAQNFNTNAAYYAAVFIVKIALQVSWAKYVCYHGSTERNNELHVLFDQVDYLDLILSWSSIGFLSIEIIWQMFRRRKACFK